jgi:predicted RNA-binding Zn ribbon-like protein
VLERLALAFVNTSVPDDVLTTAAGLSAWLAGRHVDIGPVAPEVALRLGDFRALRAAVRDAVEARATGVAVPADAIPALNEASAAVPTWPVLDAEDPRRPLERTEAGGGSATAQILATIARSAIDLVGNGEGLRVCPARRCGRVFVASRGTQVWCSPACGNRTRVARHHARRA